MGCAELMDDIDGVLGGVCLRWSTCDGNDHTCSSGIHDDELEVGKWLGI